MTVTFLPDASTTPSRVAFDVSTAVGTAVVRNRLRRRLRALLQANGSLRPGAYLVRVAPSPTERAFRDLGQDLQTALAAAHARVDRTAP